MDETYRLLMKITYQLLFGIILSIGRNIQITGENYIYVSIYMRVYLWSIPNAAVRLWIQPGIGRGWDAWGGCRPYWPAALFMMSRGSQPNIAVENGDIRGSPRITPAAGRWASANTDD